MRKILAIFENDLLCAREEVEYEIDDNWTDKQIQFFLQYEADDIMLDYLEDEEDADYLFATNITWQEIE